MLHVRNPISREAPHTQLMHVPQFDSISAMSPVVLDGWRTSWDSLVNTFSDKFRWNQNGRLAVPRYVHTLKSKRGFQIRIILKKNVKKKLYEDVRRIVPQILDQVFSNVEDAVSKRLLHADSLCMLHRMSINVFISDDKGRAHAGMEYPRHIQLFDDSGESTIVHETIHVADSYLIYSPLYVMQKAAAYASLDAPCSYASKTYVQEYRTTHPALYRYAEIPTMGAHMYYGFYVDQPHVPSKTIFVATIWLCTNLSGVIIPGWNPISNVSDSIVIRTCYHRGSMT
jgi:hypothetical protein